MIFLKILIFCNPFFRCTPVLNVRIKILYQKIQPSVGGRGVPGQVLVDVTCRAGPSVGGRAVPGQVLVDVAC